MTAERRTPAPERLRESPSQTAGPYVHVGCLPEHAGLGAVYEAPVGAAIVSDETPGERIRVEGRVLDGVGAPLTDAMVEIWQADAEGRYASPLDPRGRSEAAGFTGFARRACDSETGVFVAETVKPGHALSPDGGPMAPHLSVFIVARGINLGLHTRMYFPDEEAANAEDPVLRLVEDEARRATLIAERANGAPPTYRFDIRLQEGGAGTETVFFDV